MENYEEQIDAYSKFYSNFAHIVNESIANEIYDEAIINIADDNNWNSSEWDEYDPEEEWYNEFKIKLEYVGEEEAIEEIIRRVFEGADINVNRLKADDYEDFQDYIKEKYVFLDFDIDEDFE